MRASLFLLALAALCCLNCTNAKAQQEEQSVVFEMCDAIDSNRNVNGYVDPNRMHAIWRPDTERGWGSRLDYLLQDRFSNHLAYITSLRIQIELDDSATHVDNTLEICGPDQASLKRCADAVSGRSRSLRGSVKLDFPFEQQHHAGTIHVIEKESNLSVYKLCAASQTSAAATDSVTQEL